MTKMSDNINSNDKELATSPEKFENPVKNSLLEINHKSSKTLQIEKTTKCLLPTHMHQMNTNSNIKKLDILTYLSLAHDKTSDITGKLKKKTLSNEVVQISQKSKLPQTTDINGIIFSEATEFLRGIELRLPKAFILEILQLYEENKYGIFGNDSVFNIYNKTVRSCNDKINLTIKEYFDNFEDTKKIQYHEEKVLKENTIKCGLGTALTHLRKRGMLNQNSIDWAGRNSDKKKLPHQIMAKEALISVDDEKNEQTTRIETALRQTDEYGRVLTAKEAFRELCYHFHGKRPSQNRHMKRVKEYINDLTCKKRLTSVDENRRVEKVYEMQKKTLTPYIVL
jgi:hypothetical protein